MYTPPPPTFPRWYLTCNTTCVLSILPRPGHYIHAPTEAPPNGLAAVGARRDR